MLDADLGAREALGGILKLTDYAIFARRPCASSRPAIPMRSGSEHVLSLGPRHAGVTLGREGYLWRERKGGGHVPAFSVGVTDTTGAGDAFHGAFALMVAEGRPTADSARLAPPWRRIKCTRLGSRAGPAATGPSSKPFASSTRRLMPGAAARER